MRVTIGYKTKTVFAALATAYRQSHQTQPHRCRKITAKHFFMKIAVVVRIHIVLNYDLECYSRSITFGDTLSLMRFRVTLYRIRQHIPPPAFLPLCPMLVITVNLFI